MITIIVATIKLAWEHFVQQYHTSDSRLLRWTQLTLLFFLLTLSLTSASVQVYLTQNLQQLLGADMVISQYQPLSENQLNHVKASSQAHSVSQLQTVTLTHDGQWQSVQLKTIDDQYPLQGSLQISEAVSGQSKASQSGPRPGFIWVDSRLFSRLNLTINQPLILADQSLIVSAIISHEPDRLMEGHSVAMRAMIHQQDLTNPDVGKQLTVDRVEYRYALSTTADQQAALLTWIKTELPGARGLHREGGHPLALFWQRVENFLGLASVLLFLMAAIAIDQAGRRQLVNQKRFIALCLSMGMGRARGIVMSFLQWSFSFLLLLPVALVLAYVAQGLVIDQLQAQFAGIQRQWLLAPLLKTIAILWLLLLSFQVPGWIALSKVSVARLIRQQLDGQGHWLRLIWSLLSIAGLAATYSDNALLTGLTLGAMLATLVLLMLLTWICLTLAEKITQGRAGLLPFALFMMKQRLLSKSTQILGVGLCATLLLFTLMLMKDIGHTMERYQRTHDGNLLITQAQNHQVDALKAWASKTGSQVRALKPYARGQLVAINGVDLQTHAGKPSDSMATLQKPARMHWSAQVPSNNQLDSGQWWSQQSQDWQQVSVESEVMTDMGLTLGDKLSFMINGQIKDFTIKGSHVFKSGKGSVTFWFVVPPSIVKVLDGGIFYMGSMELPDSAWPQLASLWQQLPSLRLLSIKEMTARFDQSLAMVTTLVSAFSVMIILLAMLVIGASVKGFEADERRKNGLLLSFGRSHADCLRLSLYEWLVTGVIAALGAVCGTWLAGVLIYQSQFSLTYNPDPLWLAGTLLVIVTLVCVVGLLGSRSSLKASVVQLLE
ncbi:MAG: putative ABC transport system permease protein [Phenylobacterium sp.]|jgi:putative ABC transport system permease protein